VDVDEAPAANECWSFITPFTVGSIVAYHMFLGFLTLTRRGLRTYQQEKALVYTTGMIQRMFTAVFLQVDMSFLKRA
jgi:hypothetical protein